MEQHLPKHDGRERNVHRPYLAENTRHLQEVTRLLVLLLNLTAFATPGVGAALNRNGWVVSASVGGAVPQTLFTATVRPAGPEAFPKPMACGSRWIWGHGRLQRLTRLSWMQAVLPATTHAAIR